VNRGGFEHFYKLLSYLCMAHTPNRQSPNSLYNAISHFVSAVLRSFVFAGAGIVFLFRQRNAQVHAAAMVLVVALGLWLGLSRIEWAIVVLTIAAVLAGEGFNTAIEAVVDLASPQFHPLAKRAKDVAAGAVLLSAIAAVVIAILIFGPHIWQLFL
jgi:diacylglycerol kinase